ncbi:MAG: hypothetical protein JNL81_06635 [Hyphomonadaceae bacterium]|nr:hypothetical protein [Hyphomonadaceae bacterium]
MLVGWKPKSDDPSVASVRFRCLSPLNALREQGFPVEVFDPARAAEYSLVVFSKLYDAENVKLARSLTSQGIKTVVDLSDNHFYNPYDLPAYKTAGAQLREMIDTVSGVICCSAHLAKTVSRELTLRRPALVVGDAVEAIDLGDSSRSAFARPEGEPFRILWFGSHGSPNAPAGMEDLLTVRGRLDAAAQRAPVELVVVSNDRAKFEALRPQLNIESRYVEWDGAKFGGELARANVVIIPVNANPFTLCKSNNRLATALWYGVPVLADRIPAYDELAPFAFIDDWEAGMRHCMASSREAQLRTMAGSAYVRTRFNIREIAAQWRQAFLKLHNENPG